MDPKIGQVSKKACLKGAEDKLLEAIEDARKGVFKPNRENGELTCALGNPKHPVLGIQLLSVNPPGGAGSPSTILKPMKTQKMALYYEA